MHSSRSLHYLKQYVKINNNKAFPKRSAKNTKRNKNMNSKKYTQQQDSGYKISPLREKKILGFLKDVQENHPEAYAGHFVLYIKEGFDVKTLLPRVNRVLGKLKYSKEEYTYMYKCETKKIFYNGRSLQLRPYTFLSLFKLWQ